MSFNWPIIREKLYGICKTSSIGMTMYDAKGNKTIDPKDATRFIAKFSSNDPNLDNYSILVAIHDQGQTSFINIKTPTLENSKDFDMVHNLRNHIRSSIGLKEGIKINWQEFDHAIDPREEAVNNIKESKDISKIFGTTKSSFQKIGEAKLIIRHTDVVNEEKHGARTRHIKAFFIENKNGERFSYPHLHMSGARAFARHISNGGTNHDSIAESLYNMSQDYLSLRRIGHNLRQRENPKQEWIQTIREGMNKINRTLKSMHGPKGYNLVKETLLRDNLIIDKNAVSSMVSELKEYCNCQMDDPLSADIDRTANYLIAPQPSLKTDMEPISFTWSHRPDITQYPATAKNVLERVFWQINEISKACMNEPAIGRLQQIAEKISNSIQLDEDDLNLVREALASINSFDDASVMPEEQELDEFLNEFDADKIFSETQPKAIYATQTDDDIAEAKADNFTIDDIKRLETMTGNIEQLKQSAKQLVSTPSANPIKPEKQIWLKNAIDNKTDPHSIIKLMYDLLLSGEGMQVLGATHNYRRKFGDNLEETPIDIDITLADPEIESSPQSSEDIMSDIKDMTVNQDSLATNDYQTPQSDDEEIDIMEINRLATLAGIK